MIGRLQLAHISEDHGLHQVVWSALRVMVIVPVKREAFKLPLPGYINGVRAMKRCYNGLNIETASHNYIYLC